MTPTQPLNLAAFRAEVARRVNARLARNPVVGSAAYEWFDADWVGRVLVGETDTQADLIREIAEQVAAEMGGKP